MKKTVFILTTFLLLVGCGMMGRTPTSRVEDFLNKYQTLNKDVTDQLTDVIGTDNAMTKAQRDRYKALMEEQYRDMTYTIGDEAIDGNDATVKTQIEVYDYYGAVRDAEDYLANNPNQFENEAGAFNEEQFINYRLDEIDNQKERITYTIDFALTKNDKGDWILNNTTETDRLKIHGLYNYE
ncbi:MAG: hypothetical protein PHS45_01705 [Bacilli bacterium]|nr:hypothetical protein [Bacilli bacterium]